MSQHKATLTWKRGDADFSYKTYSRNHQWDFGPESSITASAAAQYLGDETKVDPEQAFVASLSSCHMLTFLAIASMKKIVVESYEDQAIGHLEKNEDGVMAITRVDLYPKIEFAGGQEPDKATQEKFHELAHKQCFLANSVKCPIKVNLT
ncbi:OsmC family protein [Puniceicoccaceae bacterium K14]|nr:OsmC family protein [Puniceicoccaceae bacterium K14]